MMPSLGKNTPEVIPCAWANFVTSTKLTLCGASFPSIMAFAITVDVIEKFEKKLTVRKSWDKELSLKHYLKYFWLNCAL
jgi:hypothetical protein